MASFEASVIIEYADRLYRQAASIAKRSAYQRAQKSIESGVAGAVIIGAIAFQIGQQRALALRLQAQVALCQVQIEANTRRK
jgi:hypothetical protein